MPLPHLLDVPDGAALSPLDAMHQQNAAMGAPGHGGVGSPGGAPVGITGVSRPQIGPPGLAAAPPDAINRAGLPAHLSQPASDFFPSPAERDPDSTEPINPPPGVELAESHKLKCPKCDSVQTAKNAACEGCGHPLGEARKAKFAALSVEDGNALALELGMPDFIREKKEAKPDSTKKEQGKAKKCPSCDANNAADAKKCKRCDRELIGKKARVKKKQDLAIAPPADVHQAVIYNTQGLNLAAEYEDGLLWKVACKTGTLALSPGPGQTDAEKPLELSGDLFDDMILSFQEKAFPYITVPETHANGALENTGYVRAAEVLTRDQLLADTRLPERHRPIIQADPEETRYLMAGIEFTEPEVRDKARRGTIPDTSIGVKFNYRNKRTGKLYGAAWEHLALTPMPWVDGLVPFGLSQQDGGVFDGAEAMTPYDGVYTPMNLAILFKPQDHPRDLRGRFRDIIDNLNDGQEVELPDGTSVRRKPDNEGFDIQAPGDNEPEHANTFEEAADTALEKSTAAGTDVDDEPEVVEPDEAIGDDFEDDVESDIEPEIPTASQPKTYEKTPDPEYAGLSDDELKDEYSAVNSQLKNASERGKRGQALIRERARMSAELRRRGANLSQDAPGRVSRKLREQGNHDSLHRMATKTVEQILAEERAAREAAQAEIASLRSDLSLAQGTISSQGEQLHTDNVSKKVQALEGKFAPSVLLAAKQIYLSDKPFAASGEEGLSLSVQARTADGEGTEERKLTSPTEIVDFLLSAIPTEGEGDGILAAVRSGVGSLHASAHTDANSEEAAKAAVDAAEKKRHPERFNDDGTRK